MQSNRSKHVAVAMSGGVDSSVAAGLLLRAGYKVHGIHMRLWRFGQEGQASDDAQAKAQQVADLLGFPLEVVDYRDVFYSDVVEFYLTALKQGLTPNPCIRCNRLIKWGKLLTHVQVMGCEYLASGHYARLERTHGGQVNLLRGIDIGKDQSYVLSVLPQAVLQFMVLPLGELHKSEVRKLADDFHLPMSDRKESQDLCFLSGAGQDTFINNVAPEMLVPGDILEQGGQMLGKHHGLALYTIGQRKGLGIAESRPLYVIQKDLASNSLIVGHAEALLRKGLLAGDANWISGAAPLTDKNYALKIRYKAKLAFGRIELRPDGDFIVQFEQGLRDITPGQSVVVYDGDICLGGGVIRQAVDKYKFYE